MSRGVGIAKRGFGRALSRTGYSTGGEVMDDTGVQSISDSEGLEEEIKGISGLKKIKEEDTSETKSFSKKVKETAKDFAKGATDSATKLVNAPRDAAKRIVKTLKEVDKKIKEDPGILGTGDPQRRLKKSKGGQAKVSKVMREFGKGKLHSGKKGPVVKSRKQAIAIALSEAKMSKKK